MMSLPNTANRKLLKVLTGLFAVRVIAQPVAAAFSIGGDFAFERWSSGLIVYPVLLAIQFVVLGSMVLGIGFSDRVTAGRRTIGILRGLAFAYGVTMSLRLAIGLAVPDISGWFAYPLSSAFHLVLAVYLWTWAGCIENNSKEEAHGHRV